MKNLFFIFLSFFLLLSINSVSAKTAKKFCPECGAKLLQVNQKFCSECGQKFGVTTPAKEEKVSVSIETSFEKDLYSLPESSSLQILLLDTDPIAKLKETFYFEGERDAIIRKIPTLNTKEFNKALSENLIFSKEFSAGAAASEVEKIITDDLPMKKYWLLVIFNTRNLINRECILYKIWCDSFNLQSKSTNLALSNITPVTIDHNFVAHLRKGLRRDLGL